MNRAANDRFRPPLPWPGGKQAPRFAERGEAILQRGRQRNHREQNVIGD